MNESSSGYVFDGVDQQRELARLRALEAIFDPGTQNLLEAALVQADSTEKFCCLEVGAGAGSIARLLHARVGHGGEVEAIDLDTRFLADLPETIRVTRGDMQHQKLQGRSFDLIHARFVLIHNQHATKLLDAMLAHLAPGGFLALEEPDFASAHAYAASAMDQQAFDAVTRAIAAVFERRGQHHAFGRSLPRLLSERGLQLLRVESETPMAAGDSPIARMMALSAQQLSEKYLATGHVTRDDLSRFLEFTRNAAGFAVYHATVRALARRAPSHSGKVT